MLLTPQELAAAARRQDDFDDLMLELSGLRGGHIPRFLRPGQIERIRREKGLSDSSGPLSEKWRRYIELRDAVWRRLIEIDRTLTRALEHSKKRLGNAQEALEAIRSRASLSADGRRVYRSEDQRRPFTGDSTEDRRRAFYDDGTELTREEIAKVHWREGAPSWEQRQAAGEAVRQAKQAHEYLESCKARVDHYRDRMTSGDALSADDLAAMKTDLDAMPAGLKAEFTSRGHEGAGDAAGPEPALAPACAGTGLAGSAFTFSASDLADIAQTERATQSPRPDFPSP